MRILTILVAILLPVLAQAHGDPEEKLPWNFFFSWEAASAPQPSAFYVADENEDFYRLLRGEFKEDDQPLQKVNLVNPEDRNESADIVFVKEDRSLILAQYYYRDGAGLTTYFYCFNNHREPFWYLVPPVLFPYGEKSREANIERLGWHFFTEHFLRYLVYTAYPAGTSRK